MEEQLQRVADFLISNDYHLTALELYQEVLEHGFVDERNSVNIPQALESFVSQQSVNSPPPPDEPVPGLLQPGLDFPFAAPARWAAGPPPRLPLHDALRARDRRIARLEHELRCAREDLAAAAEGLAAFPPAAPAAAPPAAAAAAAAAGPSAAAAAAALAWRGGEPAPPPDEPGAGAAAPAPAPRRRGAAGPPWANSPTPEKGRATASVPPTTAHGGARPEALRQQANGEEEQRAAAAAAAAAAGPMTAGEARALSRAVRQFLEERGHRAAAVVFAEEAGAFLLAAPAAAPEGGGPGGPPEGPRWAARLARPGALLALLRGRLLAAAPALALEDALAAARGAQAAAEERAETLAGENAVLRRALRAGREREREERRRRRRREETEAAEEEEEEEEERRRRAGGGGGGGGGGGAPETEQPVPQSPLGGLKSSGRNSLLRSTTINPSDDQAVAEPQDVSRLLSTVSAGLPNICKHLQDRHKLAALPVLLAVLAAHVGAGNSPNAALGLVLEAHPAPAPPQRRRLCQGLKSVYANHPDQAASQASLKSSFLPQLVDLMARPSDALRALAAEAAAQALGGAAAALAARRRAAAAADTAGGRESVGSASKKSNQDTNRRSSISLNEFADSAAGKETGELADGILALLTQGLEDPVAMVREVTAQQLAVMVAIPELTAGAGGRARLCAAAAAALRALRAEGAPGPLAAAAGALLPALVARAADLGCLYSHLLPTFLATLHAETVKVEENAEEGWGAGRGAAAAAGLTPALLHLAAAAAALGCARAVREGPRLAGGGRAAVYAAGGSGGGGDGRLVDGADALAAVLRGRARVVALAGAFGGRDWDEEDDDDDESEGEYSDEDVGCFMPKRKEKVQWPGLQWAVNQLLPSLMQIIAKAPQSASDAVGAPIKACCMGLGPDFAAAAVLPQLLLAEGLGLGAYPDVLRLHLGSGGEEGGEEQGAAAELGTPLGDFTPLVQIVRSQEGFADAPASLRRPFEVYRALFFPAFDERHPAGAVRAHPGWRRPGSGPRSWRALRALLEGCVPALRPAPARRVLAAVVREIAEMAEGEEKAAGLDALAAGFSRLYAGLGRAAEARERRGRRAPPPGGGGGDGDGAAAAGAGVGGAAAGAGGEDPRGLQRGLLAVCWDLGHAGELGATLVAARLFGVLAGLMDAQEVGKRVLPALVALSSGDRPPGVRAAAAAALGRCYAAPHGDRLFGQVNHEVAALLAEEEEEGGGDPGVAAALLAALAAAVPDCPPAQRDRFLLDQVVAASRRLASVPAYTSGVVGGGGADRDERQQAARERADILRTAYHAYQACMLAPQDHARLVPGLEALLRCKALLRLGQRSELKALLAAAKLARERALAEGAAAAAPRLLEGEEEGGGGAARPGLGATHDLVLPGMDGSSRPPSRSGSSQGRHPHSSARPAAGRMGGVKPPSRPASKPPSPTVGGGDGGWPPAAEARGAAGWRGRARSASSSSSSSAGAGAGPRPPRPLRGTPRKAVDLAPRPRTAEGAPGSATSPVLVQDPDFPPASGRRRQQVGASASAGTTEGDQHRSHPVVQNLQNLLEEHRDNPLVQNVQNIFKKKEKDHSKRW